MGERETGPYLVRAVDWKMPLAITAVCGITGWVEFDRVLDVVRDNLYFIDPNLLKPPLTSVLKVGTALYSSMLGLGIGCSVEKWANKD